MFILLTAALLWTGFEGFKLSHLISVLWRWSLQSFSGMFCWHLQPCWSWICPLELIVESVQWCLCMLKVNLALGSSYFPQCGSQDLKSSLWVSGKRFYILNHLSGPVITTNIRKGIEVKKISNSLCLPESHRLWNWQSVQGNSLDLVY